MKFLLDASALIAACIGTHTDYAKTSAWLAGKEVVLCPIAELALVRVGVQRYGLDMAAVRKVLATFKAGKEFIPCDISALEGTTAPSGGQSTDWYLANLAEKHGMKWATLDTRARHRATVLIA
jgi:predicted nucleic acid-binding protein